MAVLCDVYRSDRTDNLYLYVVADDGLTKVPASLLASFGEAEKTLSFELTAGRKLAKEDATVVLANLEAHGYHLQLPPADNRFR